MNRRYPAAAAEMLRSFNSDLRVLTRCLRAGDAASRDDVIRICARNLLRAARACRGRQRDHLLLRADRILELIRTAETPEKK